MKIEQAVSTYVGYKQSLGMRFTTQARMLKSFSKSVGSIEVDRIAPESVRAFLDGNGPMTRSWHCKFGTLAGFYRFCLARGYVSSVPLPTTEPRCPQTFTPYIYSEEEIKRLLQAAAGRASRRIDALTSRTLLLLLYATGLRISEALNLNLADVDLNERVLHVRSSKFYKTRLVPTGIRHSTATHLLSSGVDINTVRAWLGHASLDTTNVYAEIDLEGKARALAKCEVSAAQKTSKQWHSQPQILEFLRSL